MTALALAAFTLPEAQAIVRVNDGGNWTGNNKWYNSREDSTLVSFKDGDYVRFIAQTGKTGQFVNIIGTSGGLTLAPTGIGIETDYTFNFNGTNGAATIKQQSGVFNISKDCTLTLEKTAGENNTILELAGNAENDGKLPITQRGNIVVGAGMVFRISNSGSQSGAYAGTVYSTSTITVSGTYALFRSLYLSGYTVQRDIYHVDVNGNRTDGGDYFDGAYDNSYIQFLNVLQGGKVNVGDASVLTQDSVNYKLQDNGRAVNSNDKSGGNMTVFYKSGDANTNLSAIVGKAGASLSSVELSAGTLTVDSLVSSVVNATGGTLAFVGGGVGAVNVNGDITVSGDTNPEGKVYNIAAAKVVTFAEDLQMAGLSIVGEGGTKVTVQNVSGSAVQYALNEQNALLSASEITMTAQATGAVNVGNKVAAATVDNESGYTLTLGNGNTAVQHVLASQGNIIFHNMGAEAITLADMTIGQGKQVGVYQGADIVSEGTVSISDTLTAAGGTLLANLILDGATLDVNGGGDNALTLGSQFGIAGGTLVTLDDATVTALEGLQIGGTLDLVKALSPQDQLTYLSDDYDGMWFDQLFERTDNVHGDYKVYATGESFGLTKVSDVPEPTTGTLSLLALAALAARRRRH